MLNERLHATRQVRAELTPAEEAADESYLSALKLGVALCEARRSASDAYMDDPDNLAVYDVNIIANCDPDIIPFLDAPAGSAFTRTDNGFVTNPEGAPPE